MKKLISLCFLSIILFSCTKSVKLKAELNDKQVLPAGEWLSSNDSSSGISIREDKLAFFQNMEFVSKDIYKYKILDSVEINDDVKKVLSTYLVTYDNSDTIRYQMIQQTDSTLTLKMKNGKNEIFTLKTKN